MTYNVMLAATCSLDNIEDETACPRCTPTELCGNTCGTCELCLGKEVTDLPPECTPEAGPPMYTCDNNEQVCSDTVPFPASYYCQLACCLPFIQ